MAATVSSFVPELQAGHAECRRGRPQEGQLDPLASATSLAQTWHHVAPSRPQPKHRGGMSRLKPALIMRSNLRIHERVIDSLTGFPSPGTKTRLSMDARLAE
jgi:hypothetical protein